MGNLVVETDNRDLVQVLQNSLYPGASIDSINMVISYCQQAKLDPIQKPVHIVSMWDSKQGSMRDVVMPGIGLYRIQAARSGEYGGISEPEFGEDVTESIGDVEITYPRYCKVTVTRLVQGNSVDFTAKEFWKENYAVEGGKQRSIEPNAMWHKRPFAQIAKCAEAQALRKAFPEVGAQPTAEEMEGKAFEAQEPELVDASADVLALSQAESILKLMELWIEIFPRHQGKPTVTQIAQAKYTRKKQLMEPVND